MDAERDDLPATLLLRSVADNGIDVVLKRLRPECHDRADLLIRLHNEAGVLTHLAGTPGVIHLIDVQHDPFTIVLEYADGGSLADRLAAGIPGGAALEIAGQLVAAVRAVHARGVVHRDIKPSNILFVADALRLADFGVAAWGEPRRALPEGWAEDAVGTPPWSAPELRAEATGQVAESVDVYGVAATLCAVLRQHSDALGAAMHADPLQRPTLAEIERWLR